MAASNKTSFESNRAAPHEQLTTKKGTAPGKNDKVYLRYSEKTGFYVSQKISIRDLLGVRNAGLSSHPLQGLITIDYNVNAKVKLSDAQKIVDHYNNVEMKIRPYFNSQNSHPANLKKPIPTPRNKPSAETIYRNTGCPPQARPRTSL